MFDPVLLLAFVAMIGVPLAFVGLFLLAISWRDSRRHSLHQGTQSHPHHAAGPEVRGRR